MNTVEGAYYLVGGVAAVGFALALGWGLLRASLPQIIAKLWGREVEGKVVEVRSKRQQRDGTTVAVLTVAYHVDGKRFECEGATLTPSQMAPGAPIAVKYWPWWKWARYARPGIRLSGVASFLVGAAAVCGALAVVAFTRAGTLLGW